MVTDLPPVPPAVVKYAHEMDYNKVIPAGTWHQYRVYIFDSEQPDDGVFRFVGFPPYILYDGKTVRRANGDEFEMILKQENSKVTEAERREAMEQFKKKYNLNGKKGLWQ